MSNDRFDSYVYKEGKTGKGQLIDFTCHPENAEKVEELLKTIGRIDIPTTGRVLLAHGGFGKYTRFKVVQHRYAGGGYGELGGYIEVLEIKNAPDGRCGFVFHEYNSLDGSVFSEFTNLKNAIVVFETRSITAKELSKCKGFLRRVVCGGFEPWFYAVGDQNLRGDFVFPDIIDEDPVFRFGRKFIIRGWNHNLPIIKTCMGMRLFKRKIEDYKEPEEFRLVYWDDGTTSWAGEFPQPLDESELWIHDAIEKFRKLLTGKTSKFTIDFMNGSKFVGRFKKKLTKSHSAGGVYAARVTMKNGRVLEGKLYFEPVPEIQTVEERIYHEAEKKGLEVKSIDALIKESRGEKAWSGVYANPK